MKPRKLNSDERLAKSILESFDLQVIPIPESTEPNVKTPDFELYWKSENTFLYCEQKTLAGAYFDVGQKTATALNRLSQEIDCIANQLDYSNRVRSFPNIAFWVFTDPMMDMSQVMEFYQQGTFVDGSKVHEFDHKYYPQQRSLNLQKIDLHVGAWRDYKRKEDLSFFLSSKSMKFIHQLREIFSLQDHIRGYATHDEQILKVPNPNEPN